MSETSRRAVLAGAAGITATAVLAACGEDEPTTTTATTPGDTGAKPTGPLAKKADIPVGGGKVFGRENVVVTQPTAGEFKAFNATCTHQSCTVAAVANNVITCPCHGSQYNAADGTVKTGPAPKPLTPAKIITDGDSITLG
jgi:Rieske Fe-S protein